MDWKTFTSSYNTNGIALVLGAGVSYDSNIPTWDNLLKKMVKKYVDQGHKNSFDQLKKSGMSLPAIASLVEEHCGPRDRFIKGMRDTLYADFPFYGVKVDKSNHWDYVRFVREGLVPEKYRRGKQKYRANSTLRSVGALCLVQGKKEKSGRFFANPKIHAVATLNVDALLQTYITAFSTKRLIRTIEQPSENTFPGQLSLYHMHGFLHYLPGEADSSGNDVEGIVLTEQDYYDFFNQPNRIFNYTFLYLLREYPCLFVGLSMQDENIRRMLHYSKLERLYAISSKMSISMDRLKRGLITKEQKEEISRQVGRHYAILLRGKSPQADQGRQETLLALGVHVLWIDDFADIPVKFKELYESDPGEKGKWVSVYGRK